MDAIQSSADPPASLSRANKVPSAGSRGTWGYPIIFLETLQSHAFALQLRPQRGQSRSKLANILCASNEGPPQHVGVTRIATQSPAFRHAGFTNRARPTSCRKNEWKPCMCGRPTSFSRALPRHMICHLCFREHLLAQQCCSQTEPNHIKLQVLRKPCAKESPAAKPSACFRPCGVVYVFKKK